MKSFFTAALIAVLALFATSCYQPSVIELGDNLAKFSRRVDRTTELFGVKNTFNDVVMIEPVYQDINYSHGLIIASKGDRYDIYSAYGVKEFSHLKIKKVDYCEQYLEFETDEGLYLYFQGHELYGAFEDYDYYPGIDLLFYSLSKSCYGACHAMIDETLVEPRYSVVVCAVDDVGNECFYFGDEKTIQKIVNNREVKLTKKQLSLLKKEADAYNTPWPTKGYAVVYVKKLI